MYHNYKGYSVNNLRLFLMAITDENYRFLHVDVGIAIHQYSKDYHCGHQFIITR